MRLAGEALIGRDAELALIDELLSDARRGISGVLTWTGEPGSGKTALLAAARERADGFAVVSCCGVEWEAELPFSGLHELLRPLMGRLDALPDAQRVALEGALGLHAAQGPHTIHVYAGVLSLLLEVTREQPVLVVVDDLQWIDAASRQALAFAARRVADEPVAVLVGSRVGGRLDGLPDPRLIAPLDRDAIRALATRELGRDVSDGMVAELERATGGNPLAIVESARHAGDELWLRGGDLEVPLPVGDLIERAFRDRLEPLSPDARRAAELVAASTMDQNGVIREALDRLGISPTALDEASQAEVLELDGARWRFVHPLLRSIVHGRATDRDLRACHRALADSAPDGAERVWHLAAATDLPDEEIAAAIEAAAQEFAARGGPLAAAKALRRAPPISRRIRRSGLSA